MGEEKRVRVKANGGGCGCLGIVVFGLLVWALVFGVTYGGHHHEVSCSCAKGVEVQ